ncbi:hypothetical protein NE865_13260 [Phthorimaea operculella]|nr:hypothetical protein NE865_13260 [Phthorimaea operculella]
MTVNLTQEQFQQLLASIGGTRKGTMSSCKASYSGRKDREAVEAFITALQVFKKIEKISDADALAGLPLVLHEDAAVWWQGAKNSVKTWAAFEEALRSTFAPKKPEFLIYLEACSVKQSADTSTDEFISRKRMLFSELPEDEKFTDKQQLNIVFGLLNLKIRDRVAREKVKDFDDLLKQARSVEALLKEKETDETQPEYTSNELPNSKSDLRKKKSKRCNFCKKLGHVLEECRKRKSVMDANNGTVDPGPSTSNSNATTAKFVCYGCGTPGVYRSNCKLCSNKPKQNPENKGNLGFGALNIQAVQQSRPVVFLEVNGISGKAYVDPCAKVSVASRKLHELLKERGQTFSEDMATITMADGHPRLQKVLLFEAEVELCGRRTKTPFIVLLQSSDNRTLLGIDF